MTTLEKSQRNLLIASFWLILIHLVVSFAFIIIDFTAATKTKTSGGALTFSGIGWLISFIVCFVVLILLLATLAYEKQRTDTPCPLQLSYPDERSQDRKDIKSAIDSIRSMTPAPKFRNGLPPLPTQFPIHEWLPYDPSRVYVIVTGYYILREETESPMKDELQKLISKYPNFPVAYVEDNKLYSMAGKEWWPAMDLSDA